RFAAQDTFQLAGMESASLPLLTALALVGRRLGKKVSIAFIRKERKTSGLGRNIEGELASNSVILVDDVINRGRSAEKGRAVLARAGASVASMFVVIDYRARDSLAWRKQHNIDIQSLFTLEDLGLALRAPTKPPPSRQYRPLWGFDVPGASAYHVVPKSAP